MLTITPVNVRAYSLSRVALFIVDAIDRGRAEDLEAVPDLLNILVEQIESLTAATDQAADNGLLYDAGALARSARQLYDPNGDGASNSDAAVLLYQLEGTLSCAVLDDYT